MIQVASYCRVSTDKEDQANSFESQQRYFKEYIEKNPDWELYEIYADEGISGTNTRKRIQFNRMIQDAHQGKFQLILTKEVSRFSRNIVDTLSYTRELKRIGVAVEFLTDHINTMDGDGELRLSIMATLAQDESRKTSNRVVWGQTRQMEKGVVFGRSMLGYEVNGGKLTVEPHGAEIVRLIFQKYAVEQVSTSEIARFLTREGFRTYLGSSKWKPSAVIKILKNEKYVGDLVQKKTYTPDYLTHEKRTNKGQVPFICLKDHHEPIITREIWNLAQARMQKNNKHGIKDDGRSNRYVFSGKIKCAQCGASFVSRMKTLKGGTKVRRWSCRTAVSEGRAACSIGKLIRDDDAMHMLKIAMQSLSLDTHEIIHNVTTLSLDAIREGEGTANTPERLQFKLEQLQKKKENVMDSYFSGDISKEDMLAMKKRYEIQSDVLQNRLAQATERKRRDDEIQQMRDAIQSQVAALLRFDTESEVLCKTVLDHLTVFPDRHIELCLNCLPQVFRFTG
ncbi:recombinase family protein [Pseudoflavonifractor phocaeensis]|uniref:recombinase family protein n=1 Tax=Pseudoflavonifractor phocaeensis TaxID=1870988 RepID=UPI00195AF4ED|nr:recombinase family protein [Pseudoflavonifractor phocaeensis]MBM6926448.1 recombinase family protein [Pseudoflavonifractor phocaeensis]